MARNTNASTLIVGKSPGTVENASRLYIADCKSRNLSNATVSLTVIILKGLCDYLEGKPLADVTSHDLRKFFIKKATSTSSATAARYYECLHAFFKFLHKEGFLHSSPMTTVTKPKAPTPLIEPLAQEQIEAMVNACGTGFAGIRDRLILLVLIDCGLRASELCDLTMSDIDWENCIFLIRHGKGDKARRVPFGSVVASTMRQYLARRAEVDTPYLLVTVYGERVDRHRLRSIVKAVAAKAGITHKHMCTHLLRHTFAVSYLRAGGDVFSLQKVLGHSTLTMTRRYSELADSDIQEKHRLYSPGDRLKLKEKAGRRRLR